MRRRELVGGALLACTPSARSAVHTIDAGGGRAGLHFDAAFDDSETVAAALVWAQRSADAVARYLGRLPLRRFDVLLQGVDGAGVKGGSAYPEPRPHLRIRLGQRSRAAQLDDDWILVHEMLHLALPQLARPHRWLHEGVATYAEGAARVQAGINPAARWWGELVQGLPQGLPQAGDRGLDHTPTWGRIYWGGALFCLLADVRMRKHSDAGLREALQRLLAAGGNYSVAWPIKQVLERADDAEGTLSTLYAEMKDTPHTPDLDSLWRELGVYARRGQPTRLDDNAPLAALRRAIAVTGRQPNTN